MHETNQNIPVPHGKWIDIYKISGLGLRTRIIVQNVGSTNVYLSTSTIMPNNDADSYQIIRPNEIMINDVESPGEWAFSPNQDSKINVRVAL